MTEDHRKENQRYCVERCQREGWLDENSDAVWPQDGEARAEMGRSLFGLALTNALDSIFITWHERAFDTTCSTVATPGSLGEHLDERWRRGFESMSKEQRDFVLRVIDDVLDFAAYKFTITLDRFEFGDLGVHLTVMDDEREPKFTVPIHPHGHFEMFQDVLKWKEDFGRGSDIGRPESDDRYA